MDKSFLQMETLLRAVWPAVSAINWADYCNERVSTYDDDGIPKYTGILIHRSGGGCVGGNTFATGFLPRPEKSAQIVAMKTGLIDADPRVQVSMERRNPKKNHWGGGIRQTSHDVKKHAYGLTGLPEIGDHLLLARMMSASYLLSDEDFLEITRPDTDYMAAAREFVDMDEYKFGELRGHMSSIVQDARKAQAAAA